MELRELLMNKLRALYDMESVIIDSMPDIAEAVTDKELAKSLKDHLKETKGHSKKLEDIFKLLGEKPEKLEGEAIRGMAEDAEWVIENVDEGDALDLNLIAALSYVEHYEMAGYNAARMWATHLGESDVADILDTIYLEEETADMKLNDKAEEIAERLA